MGQWFDVGLQAGKSVAEKVDEFIKREGFTPNKRRTLSDGSTIYRWYMKWNPYWFKDEKRFVELLNTFDGNPEFMSDEEYENTAYKLVAVGDEGGTDEIANDGGYELFDGIYNSYSVTYPAPFDDEDKSIDKNELRTKVEAVAEIFERYCKTLGEKEYREFYDSLNGVLSLLD